MGNGMTKVLPGLYLGNFIDAKDPDQLGRNKITHIISIHESPQPLLQDITYLRIPVADTPEVPIKKHFKECINFIHCCRLNGGNCLVHCFAGISRSTTIVTAYVMTVTGLGWRDVLEAIKATRPIANPNPGFRQQLEEFGWGSSRKLRRQLEERFGESPFRDEEDVRALLPLCKRCRQGSAAAAASPAAHSAASEGTLQRLVPRPPREAHRPLPLLARVKQTFSCLPRCLSRKGGKPPLIPSASSIETTPPRQTACSYVRLVTLSTGPGPQKAWAIYKGKHLEGIDKEDPPTWKTRLRCALNKSADFCEVRERSQLDVSNPYKVYRIVSNGAHCPVARACAPPEKKNILQSQQESPREVTEPACRTDQDSSRSTTEDKNEEQPPRLAQRASLPSAAQLTGPLADHRYQVQEPAYHWSPLPSSEDFSNPDCWLHVRLFYGAELVQETTARTAEGCRLSPRAVTAAEHLLGPPPRVAQVRFPEPPPGARVLRHLLRHLERGVLLWVAPEGVFAKRLCRGRVYWRGPLAPHRAQPNKLERERTCQLLDTRRFLEELRAHLQDGGQEPEYQIHLCFGEEYPGPPDQPEERLIMAHVEPVFARQLFLDSKHHYRGTPAMASPQLSMSDGVTHLLTAQLNQQ